MPTKIDNGSGRTPRTLAGKLQWLRDLKTPRGEQPPSYDATARRISKETGVSISGPYYWELVTGRTTNPKLHHLQAIARFFNVPVGYLSEEEADFEQLESELELLHALKQRGVRNITLQGETDAQADLATVQTLLGRLQMLGPPEDQEARERLSALNPRQRAILHEVITDTATLEALEDERLRELIRATTNLRDDHLSVLLSATRQPDLLDALHTDSIRHIVPRMAALSETSQQAVLAMIDHLHQIEEAKQE
jgi:transcriptional regulator with XRE-family HTH domain